MTNPKKKNDTVSVNEDLELQVRKMVAEKFGLDLNKVTNEAEFAVDLGLDSIETQELVMLLEEAFHVSIPESVLEEGKVQTVADAIALIRNLKKDDL